MIFPTPCSPGYADVGNPMAHHDLGQATKALVFLNDGCVSGSFSNVFPLHIQYYVK